MIKIPFNNVVHIIDDDVKTKELYEKVINEQKKMYNYLLNDNLKSRYNNVTIDWIYKYYPNIPLGECENVNKNEKIYGLDCAKAYTSCLLNLEFLTQIDFFELPKKYDGHEIKDYFIYLVEILETNDIFNKSFTHMFGINLKQLNLDYEIKEYLEYTRIISNKKCKKEIKNLYNKSGLSEKLCKFICNSSIGMTGKKYNKKTLTKICEDLKNAELYKKFYNDGETYPIGDNDDDLYLFVKKYEEKLINGFVFIDMLIKDTNRMKMYKLNNDLINFGVNVVGYKVDCVFFTIPNNKLMNLLGKSITIEDIKNKFVNHDSNKTIFDNIGSYKLIDVDYDDFSGNLKEIEYKNIDYMPIEENNKIFLINIGDEYNPDLIKIDNYNCIIIKGLTAGTGKTELCLIYALSLKVKFVVVVPHNKNIDDIKKRINKLNKNQFVDYDVMTYHHFFNMDPNGNKLHNKINYNDYKLVIFEEIYTMNSNLLINVHKLMNKFSNLKYIANGDINQLPPVDEKLNDKKKCEMIDYLFKNQIKLKISKRFKNDERFKHIKKLVDKYIDSSEEQQKECINYIINELFKNQHINNLECLEKLGINNAITYTNDSRNYINDYIHKLNLKKNNEQEYYYKGLKLICKQRIKTKEFKFNKNQEYSITNIDKKNNNIYIENQCFKREVVENNFTLNYVYTCHSAQGITIDDKYLICDYKFEYVNLKWLYTAITRSTDLNNIYFYTEFIQTDKIKIKQHIKKMIINYKEQDKKACRELDDKKYITYEWVINKIKKQNSLCYHCGNMIDIDIHNKLNNDDKLTIDRKINDISHYKTNCILSCLSCNLSKKEQQQEIIEL